MKNDVYIYPAVFDYAEDGISVEFPDLPGCLTCADNDREALYMAKDALRLWLLTSEEEDEEISTPTPLKDIRVEDNQKAVLVEVCLAGFREAFKNRAIKKTLTIPEWLNEAALAENVNFSQVLQNALIEVLGIKR